MGTPCLSRRVLQFISGHVQQESDTWIGGGGGGGFRTILSFSSFLFCRLIAIVETVDWGNEESERKGEKKIACTGEARTRLIRGVRLQNIYWTRSLAYQPHSCPHRVCSERSHM